MEGEEELESANRRWYYQTGCGSEKRTVGQMPRLLTLTNEVMDLPFLEKGKLWGQWRKSRNLLSDMLFQGLGNTRVGTPSKQLATSLEFRYKCVLESGKPGFRPQSATCWLHDLLRESIPVRASISSCQVGSRTVPTLCGADDSARTSMLLIGTQSGFN